MQSPQIYAIFYKHTVKITNWRTFKEWLIDKVIRLATRSKYSHCELAVKRQDGQFVCYSSSPRDGGVRKKVMALDTAKWDFVKVQISHNKIKCCFAKTRGKKYDLLGAIGIPFKVQDNDKWFCSEWCATALGLSDTQISPQGLYNQMTKNINFNHRRNI